MKNLLKCICIVVIIGSLLAKSSRTAKYVRQFPAYGNERLTTLDYPSYNIIEPDGPGTYAFGYEAEDPFTGNLQFRDEERLRNGTVRGTYGYMQMDGTVYITRFISDYLGYRAQTEIKRTQNSLPMSNIPMVHMRPTMQGNYPQNIDMNPTYNPLLDENVIAPQYAASILSQNNPSRPQNYNYQPLFGNNFGLVYPNTFPFANFQNAMNQVSPFVSNVMSQNPNAMNQVSPFVSNVMSQNPFSNVYSPQNTNYLTNSMRPQSQISQSSQQQTIQSMPPVGVMGDSMVFVTTPSSIYGITTKRRRTTTKKIKTKHGQDWLDDFLDNRKREVVATATKPTAEENES